MALNQYQKNNLLAQLNGAIEAVKNMPVVNNCATCANCDLGGGPARCRAAGVIIPAEVMEAGCEAYIHDHTLPPF